MNKIEIKEKLLFENSDNFVTSQVCAILEDNNIVDSYATFNF